MSGKLLDIRLHNRTGILFLLAALFLISLNDMGIKALSGDYPLHQIVFVRSAVGIFFSFVILHLEGGLVLLKTDQPGLHLLRALLVVLSNSCFYAAVVVMPLAMVNALYFISPLIVTLLSIPVLGEQVGPRRLSAMIAGFCGVLLMIAPELTGKGEAVGWAVVLPLFAAVGYAGMAVLTRKLGQASSASALTIYLQIAFLIVSLAFFAIAGDGRFADGTDDASLIFLLRAWIKPASADIWPMLGLGVVSAGVGYCLSQAYRLSSASVVAPFEYVLMIFALFWGWVMFGEWPGPTVFAGAGIVITSGIYIAIRGDQRRVPRRP